MMKTPMQNDLRLEMALKSMWIICAHESQKLRTTENKREVHDKHITLSTQIWIEWPV